MSRKALRRLAANIEREYQLRQQRAVVEAPPWSIEAFCGGHAPQLAAAVDRSPFLHLMCARQSGKTWDDDGILFDNAQANPRSTNIFLGLVGTGVRLSNWFPIWKVLCAKYGVPDSCHNEQMMLTTFPNQSRVVFGGTDDLTNVKKYLGNRLDNCVFIVDEAQDQKDSVIHYILRVLLPPMLTPTTRVILSGVLPDVEAGMFYELAADKALVEAPEGQASKGWSHHEWGRAANVHTPEAMEQLAEYMRLTGLTEDDPQIARDWFLRRVWDPGATAYRYRRARAGYDPVAPDWLAELYEARAFGGNDLLYCHPFRRLEGDACLVGLMAAVPEKGVDTFSFAIDPGATTDRVAIEGIGYGKNHKGAQHLFDWATPRGMNLSTSQIYALAAVAHHHYSRIGYVRWRYDAGSSQNTIDNLRRDYGIPLILPAKKTDMKGQVDRAGDLLERGEAAIMIGSALEQDLQRAVFDPDKRKHRIFEWKSNWHPDPSEAWRYTLPSYHDRTSPPPRDEHPDAAAEALRKAKLTPPDTFDGARHDIPGFAPGRRDDFGPVE